MTTAETLPDDPDDDEIIIDDPDLPQPPDPGPRKKVYVDGIAAAIVRRAGGIPRRARQAGYRVTTRLHQESPAQAFREP